MNILELIADVLEHPEDARQRMHYMGVNPAVIDAILALSGVEITDDFPNPGWGRTITFVISE